MRRAISIAVVAAMTLVAFALPATATVDELTGMPCSGGKAIFGPPGITGGSNADNFANPLFASGFASFIPGGGPGGDDLISFDENHPASKITLTGEIVPIGPGLWLTEFEFDLDRPFANCAALS